MSKNFNNFLFSSAFSLLGIEIFHLAIPLVAIDLGFSAIEIGWCTFAFFLPVIVIKVFSSTIIEKKSKKKTLIYSEVGRLTCTILFIIGMYLLKDESLFWVIVIAFIFGTFTVFTEVTEPAALKILIQGKDSVAILSRYEIRTRAIQLVAPLICGGLITLSAFYPYFIGVFISFLAVFFLLKINLTHASECINTKGGFVGDIKEALGWMRERRFFSLMVALTSINNLLHPILYLGVIFSLQSNDFGFDITGAILSGLGVGGILGSFISKRIISYFSFRTLVLGVNTLRILVFIGFLVFQNPIGYFVFFVLKAILGGVWNVSYNIYSIREMPDSHVARISALSGLMIKASAAAGSLLAGYFISYLGVQVTFFALVLLTIFMLVCSFPYKAEYEKIDLRRREI
ncbi:MFS transporter [Edaphovirga cremea]|uniref:MFS transporter n=1 Tax=Edaphovirga cremea TaxID=2267246 RepID=UPI000DEF4333|nr:MFS transporter [Edaphovirga cremea]